LGVVILGWSYLQHNKTWLCDAKLL